MKNLKELLDEWKIQRERSGDTMLTLVEGLLQKQKENAPLEIEKTAIDFKELIDNLPKNIKNKLDFDVLSFLGVVIMDFLPFYYQARGLAIDAREGKQVDQKILFVVALEVLGHFYTFEMYMRHSLGFHPKDKL